MSSQTINGKAFEYATLLSLYGALSHNQHIEIIKNSSFITAENAFNNLLDEQKSNNLLAAKSVMKILLKFEPQLTTPENNSPRILVVQEDQKGIIGDVRDIITVRNQNNWEIGISCKHNHKALKHSRLSDTNDFGKAWFGKPCSSNYWNQIIPIFTELRNYQKQTLWRELENKETYFYCNILDAFIQEIKFLDQQYPFEIPKLLIQYLLGSHDFYKIITEDKKRITHVQCFNLYGTLNRSAGSIKPQQIFKTLTLPTRFLDISYKDNLLNTIIVTCDNGWSVSMRIHNASSRIEPSLKFDVNLIGQPSELYTTTESW